MIDIRNMEKKHPLPNEVKMPKIPKAFIEHPKVKYVFYHIINDFDYEEKVAIYFYCFENLSICEIADLTKLSQNHVASVLNLYGEKLTSKVHFFKQVIPHNANELLPVSEILFPECEMS